MSLNLQTDQDKCQDNPSKKQKLSENGPHHKKFIEDEQDTLQSDLCSSPVRRKLRSADQQSDLNSRELRGQKQATPRDKKPSTDGRKRQRSFPKKPNVVKTPTDQLATALREPESRRVRLYDQLVAKIRPYRLVGNVCYQLPFLRLHATKRDFSKFLFGIVREMIRKLTVGAIWFDDGAIIADEDLDVLRTLVDEKVDASRLESKLMGLFEPEEHLRAQTTECFSERYRRSYKFIEKPLPLHAEHYQRIFLDALT